MKAGERSDPYLIGFYDKKTLKLSHNTNEAVTFTLEADPVGNGPWMTYRTFVVKPGETVSFTFPQNFSARWLRFTADKPCKATTWLDYQ